MCRGPIIAKFCQHKHNQHSSFLSQPYCDVKLLGCTWMYFSRFRSNCLRTPSSEYIWDRMSLFACLFNLILYGLPPPLPIIFFHVPWALASTVFLDFFQCFQTVNCIVMLIVTLGLTHANSPECALLQRFNRKHIFQ